MCLRQLLFSSVSAIASASVDAGDALLPSSFSLYL
jgi:hypothetical protein